MDSVDLEILDLFKKYSEWLKASNINDTIYNYIFYLDKVYTP